MSYNYEDNTLESYDFFKDLSSYINKSDYSSYTLQYPPPFIGKSSGHSKDLINSFKITNSKGLYIHIPFCDTKCTFCRYFSYVEHKDVIYKKYVDYLKKELKLYQKGFGKINSLYFGGGTPSILSSVQLDDLLGYIFNNFIFTKDFQFCFEANPSSLDAEKIKILKKYSCHRLTIGVQSMDLSVLKQINRKQSLKDVISAITIAKSVGIPYINIDLMLGIRGQTIKSFIKDLLIIINFEVDMIHLHPFVPTDNVIDKDASYNDKKLKKQMTNIGYKLLLKYGYKDNEDDACSLTKNSVNKQLGDAQKLGEYLGIGLGAVGFSKLYRYINTNNLEVYYKKLDNGLAPFSFNSKLTNRDNMIQYIIYNMRYGSVDLDDFYSIFSIKLEEEFRSTLSILKTIKVVSISNNKIIFSFNDIDDYEIYSKYFYDKQLLKQFKEYYYDL